MSADRVDVIGVIRREMVRAGGEVYSDGRDLIAVMDAVAKLIKRTQSLTEAVRGFADGDMSDELWSRLFLAASSEPAKESFALMCDANDQAEAALSRIAQPGDGDE